jgi:hypothetical protein
VLLGVLAVLSVLAAAGYVYLQRTPPPPLVTADLAAGARQRAALETYAARAALGSFLPPDDAVIAIREQFLQDVLDRSLPWRQTFEDGRYVVHLDRALVRLEPGVAHVTLAGRGMPAGPDEERAVHVALEVRGHIAIAGVEPDSGRLRAVLVVTDVRTPGMRREDVQNLVNPVARYFGRMRAEDWNRNRRRIRIPIRVEREFVLPETDGKVAMPETRLPLALQVSAVTTLDRRMAVSLALRSDAADPEPHARPPDPRWNGERAVTAPRAGADSLRSRVARLAAADPLWRSVTSTDHDVVVVVPEPLLHRLVDRVAQHYLRGVEVDIQPRRVVPVKARVRASILGKQHRVAHFEGHLKFGRLRGVLTLAGHPRVRLVPPDGLAIAMPARVVRGRGAVSLDLEWKPAALLGVVCRPFRVQETVAGTILPFTDTLNTHIRYQVLDSVMVGRPRVQRDRMRVPIDLTDSSWALVRARLVEQDRLGRCGLLMDPDAVIAKLRELAAEGVSVRMPRRMFKPFRVPVLLEEHYTTGSWRIEARTWDPRIEVRPGHLRLAFRAGLRVMAADSTRVARSLPTHTGRTSPPAPRSQPLAAYGR